MTHHIAQANVGIPLAPLDSPQLAEFMAALDPVNAIADASPGFVWRLQGDSGNATEVATSQEDLLINMSVWESIEALRDFVYRNPEHRAIMRERRRFFVHLKEAIQVLWWVPAGHIPTVAEAEARLAGLRRHGPTPAAFTFQVNFPAPGAAAAMDMAHEDLCPA